MQWYVDIVTISAAAILGWVAVGSLGLPIRALIGLRHDVFEQMLVLENIALPKPRELAVSSREINAYDQAMRNLREAQLKLRNLGSQLLSLVENEPAACNALLAIGLNVAEAGTRLVELSVSYSQPNLDRTDLRAQIKKALHWSDVAAKRRGEFFAVNAGT